jgi:nucleotide-binding universal stress UspA family protein
MLKRILVPLDGSPLAERALPYARTLAQAAGARIWLLRAVPSADLAGVKPHETQEREFWEAEGYLRDQSVCLPAGSVEFATFGGGAAEGIVSECRSRQVDLVVMATHGRSGLGRWVFGSVAAGVLARAPAPVLLVRAWQAEQGLALPVVGPRVLVPLDGSAFAEDALPVARDLAGTLGGTLTLLQCIHEAHSMVVPGHETVAGAVNDPLTYMGAYVGPREVQQVVSYNTQELEAERGAALDYLKGVQEEIAEAQATLPVQLEVRVGAPAHEIIAASRELGANLVVMATHGRTGPARLLLGSVADRVLREGSVPVLLVRPPGLGEG